MPLTPSDFRTVPQALHRQTDDWPLVFEGQNSRVYVRPAAFTDWTWDDDDLELVAKGLRYLGVGAPGEAHWTEFEYRSLLLLAEVLGPLAHRENLALFDDFDGVWPVPDFVAHVRRFKGDRREAFAEFYARRPQD